jgi:hypothetical protein
MHSCLLSYQGYTIVVENYLYKLAIDPTHKYLTMDDVKNVIDRMVRIENLKTEPNGIQLPRRKIP